MAHDTPIRPRRRFADRRAALTRRLAQLRPGRRSERSGRRRPPGRMRPWWTATRTRVRTHPVIAAVTPMGWAVLAGLALSAGFGWLLNWVEFRGLTVMLAVLWVIALASILKRTDHVGTLHLLSRRIRVGETGDGRVLLRSRDQRPVGATTVELPVGGGVARFRVGGLSGSSEHEQLFTVPGRRRGVITIGPVRTVRSDPVGLVRRVRELAAPVELFVHPEIAAVETGAIGFLKDVEGVTTQTLSSSDVAFHALRPYAPGDDRRAIHWKTTARTGTLMVRQFEETRRAHLLLMLSTRPQDYPDASHFELAVCVAASIGVATLREGRQLTVRTSTRSISVNSTGLLLDEFCRVGLEAGSPALPQVAMAGFRDAPATSVAAFVTGSRVEIADLRAAQLQLPQDVRCFAVRCSPGLSVSRRRIAQLTIFDVPNLPDLVRAMRSL